MKLLSKPKELDYTHEKEYYNYRFFQLALTERNWSGKEYITKEDCLSFMNELKELDDLFHKFFGDVLCNSRLAFLIDTSVFSGEIEENHKLIDFLEDLDDFVEYDAENKEEAKKANKYLNKFKSFKNKPENFAYIFRWVLTNEHHPFATEIKDLVLKEIEKIGFNSKRTWTADAQKAFDMEKKLVRRGLSEEEVRRRKLNTMNQLVIDCEKRDTRIVSQILKYGFGEPSLFFYGVYFVILYFKQLEDIMPPGYEFITFEKKSNKTDVFLKDSTVQLNTLFLKHETFISSLPRVKRRADGYVTTYSSLYDVKTEKFDDEEQIKGVLRTISNWIISRIPSDTEVKMPNKKWLHVVKGELFTSLGLQTIYFEDISIIGGPVESELLIKAHAFLLKGNKSEDLLFPLFDPESWDNLNAMQCAIITYALCLFHDIAIEKNYELVKETSQTSLGQTFDYFLVTNEKDGVVSPLQLLNEPKQKQKGNEKKVQNTKEEDNKKVEHWVSFHFRRLKQGYNASEKQKSVAAKYGIKELPPGFTFVDSHVRGERNVDTDQIHFSALEVLNKTLSKLNNYYKEEQIKEIQL